MYKNTLKFSLFLIFLFVVTCAVFLTKGIKFERKRSRYEPEYVDVTTSKMFDSYLKKYNKSYTETEYIQRLEYFRQSLVEIARSNRETGAVHGLNIFADLSDEEFSRRFQTYSSFRDNSTSPYLNCTNDNSNRFIPGTSCHETYKDWREDNKVSPILDQGQCSSCWAHTIIGIMESMLAIQKGTGWTRRSIQELLDCIPNGVSDGCISGTVDRTLDYMCLRHISVTTETNYPLTENVNTCRDNITEYNGLRIKEFWTYRDMNENVLRCVIAKHGPVAVIVNARPWKFYVGGIIQRACMRSKDGKSLLHAVQIVGYDTRGSVPYYIVRNSYGEKFGDHGYVKLSMYSNTCGVADVVSFVSVY